MHCLCVGALFLYVHAHISRKGVCVFRLDRIFSRSAANCCDVASQVCELDIIFNFEKAYFILDEFLLGGEAQETSKKNVLKAIEQADLLQEVSSTSFFVASVVFHFIRFYSVRFILFLVSFSHDGGFESDREIKNGPSLLCIVLSTLSSAVSSPHPCIRT